jgi:hypothetical protein
MTPRSTHEHHRQHDNDDDTETLEVTDCPAHSGVCIQTRRNNEDIQNLFLLIECLKITINDKFMKMYYMVIAALAAIILMCGTWAINNFHLAIDTVKRVAFGG